MEINILNIGKSWQIFEPNGQGSSIFHSKSREIYRRANQIGGDWRVFGGKNLWDTGYETKNKNILNSQRSKHQI